MTGLIIDLKDLTGTPGASIKVRVTEPVGDLRVTLGKVGEPLEIDLLAETLREGIAVTGWIRGKMSLVCARCLTEFDREFEQPVDEVFYREPDDEEGYVLDGDTMNLEPLVRDTVVLAIPVSPLHHPECLGLCPVCGADRNKADCGHRIESFDLRWEPLRRLVEEGGLNKEDAGS